MASRSHLKLSSVLLAVGLALSGCSLGVEPGDIGSKWEDDVANFSDDSRQIDRGLQEGRSKHSGWPATEFVVADAFLAPWPDSFTRKELIDSALARSFAYFDQHATPSPPPNLTIHFEDSFPEEHHDWVIDLASVSASFPKEFTTHEFDLVVGEPGYAWDVIAELGLWTPAAGHCGGLDPDGVVGGCASRGAVSANYGGAIASGELNWSGTLPSIVPHEMFHSVQDVLDPDPESGARGTEFPRPDWFWEGSAEFFGYAVGDYAGVVSYYVSPWEWWYYLPSPEVSLRDYSKGPSFAVPPEWYWKGQIATEYIVASIGVEGMLEISRELGSGKIWEDAFEAATGLGMDDFYKRFDSAYRNMFELNKDLRTYENRECPQQWNCYVQWGDDDFNRIEEEKEWPVGTRGVLSDQKCGNLTETELSAMSWWVDCIDSVVVLPSDPESSRNNMNTNFVRTPTYRTCDELNSIGSQKPRNGVAATFDIRDRTGATKAYVSTIDYAANYLRDFNGDGVICNSQVPDPVE